MSCVRRCCSAAMQATTTITDTSMLSVSATKYAAFLELSADDGVCSNLIPGWSVEAQNRSRCANHDVYEFGVFVSN